MSEDSMGRNMRGQEDVRNLIENGGVQDELRRQFSASSRGPNTFSFWTLENRYILPGAGAYVHIDSNPTSGTNSVSVWV